MILRLTAIVLFFLLLGVSIYVTSLPPSKEVLLVERVVPIRNEIAEGLKVGRAGIYGIDLISCGRIGMEKRKRGPFALGGFNTLVLDNLKVVLPVVLRQNAVDENSKGVDAAAVLRDIGVSHDYLRSNGIRRKFSGLRINGLELSRLDDATNVVCLFTARSGDFKRVGLELKDLKINGMNGVESVSTAILKKSHGGMKLICSSGEIKL
jgi:hypothetical protein